MTGGVGWAGSATREERGVRKDLGCAGGGVAVLAADGAGGRAGGGWGLLGGGGQQEGKEGEYEGEAHVLGPGG